jgi:hypothetical protein
VGITGCWPFVSMNFQVQYSTPSNYLTLANSLLPSVNSVETHVDREFQRSRLTEGGCWLGLGSLMELGITLGSS